MDYYVFNDGKRLESDNGAHVYVIHHCQNCNTNLIGEWVLKDSGLESKLKDAKKEKEFFEFASLDTCLICGENFTKNPEHHFTNRLIKKASSGRYCLVNSRFLPSKINYRGINNGLRGVCNNTIANSSIILNGSGRSFTPGDKVITEYGPAIVSSIMNDGKLYLENYRDDFESMLSFFKYFQIEKQKQIVTDMMEKFVNKCTVNNEDFSTNNISTKNDFNLKSYLEQLLLIEKNVFSISKRLEELYAMDYNAERDALVSEKLMVLKYKNPIKDALKEYENLKAKDVEKDITIKDFPITYPDEPQKPQEPVKPVLATPGFFNKKRVLAENALLTEKYEKALEKYNLANEQYKADVEKRKEAIALLETQRENEYKLAIENAKEILEKEINAAREKYEDLLKKQNAAENSAKNIPTTEKAKHLFLKEEIEIAEELLEKFYKAQNEMYSCGIIFEKYRNFVAVSTFYEYISSSRCETLDGPDGAYNLYENEIRMNMVIGQLNQVIESLEEIKQNQYMIYSAVQETNKLLKSLNVSTSQMLGTLDRINEKADTMESYMSTIAENTEVIAYNTEKTAFYAKKNAELTNALGYMVAFK